MAKFKASRGRKGKPAAPAQGAIPCVIILLLGALLVALLLYFALRSYG
ncbi:MAG: hypothetical protein IT160_08720 [Bryobacterales bacterium]|nr:hypothetical protein [Bryobacterales bacterium]